MADTARAPLKFIPGRPPGPPKKDYRTIPFKRLPFKTALPPAPETADVDVQVGGITEHEMWLNNIYGNCVVADWLAALDRHEKYEQGVEVIATNAEAKKEYFTQTGGVDSGLNMLDYLNHLRKEGIKVGGKLYKIHAFASIDPKDHEDVRNGINLFRGVYFGMMVPQSMIDQFDAGEIFDVVPGSPLRGGHAVYGPAYLRFVRVTNVNEIGPVFRTWAKRVQGTWPFWDENVDECYIVIDERDDWLTNPNNPLEPVALDALLAEVINQPPPVPDPNPPPTPDPNPPPTPPKPPGCLLCGFLGEYSKNKVGIYG